MAESKPKTPPKRYAAYDNTLLRFVSSPGTKAAAEKAADAAPESHDVEVREV